MRRTMLAVALLLGLGGVAGAAEISFGGGIWAPMEPRGPGVWVWPGTPGWSGISNWVYRNPGSGTPTLQSKNWRYGSALKYDGSAGSIHTFYRWTGFERSLTVRVPD